MASIYFPKVQDRNTPFSTEIISKIHKTEIYETQHTTGRVPPVLHR